MLGVGWGGPALQGPTLCPGRFCLRAVDKHAGILKGDRDRVGKGGGERRDSFESRGIQSETSVPEPEIR